MLDTQVAKFAGRAVVGLCLAAMCGCSASIKAGNDFDPSLIGRTIQMGSSTTADVRSALGEPWGKGSAMMPFHDHPHLAWNYFIEHGSANMSSGTMTDQGKYLLVFFDGDRVDSYIWFDYALH